MKKMTSRSLRRSTVTATATRRSTPCSALTRSAALLCPVLCPVLCVVCCVILLCDVLTLLYCWCNAVLTEGLRLPPAFNSMCVIVIVIHRLIFLLLVHLSLSLSLCSCHWTNPRRPQMSRFPKFNSSKQQQPPACNHVCIYLT